MENLSLIGKLSIARINGLHKCNLLIYIQVHHNETIDMCSQHHLNRVMPIEQGGKPGQTCQKPDCFYSVNPLILKKTDPNLIQFLPLTTNGQQYETDN